MNWSSPLWLASRSPRRQQMLNDAGFDVRVQPPDFDDGALKPGLVSPYQWVVALAHLKAWRVADIVRGIGDHIALWGGEWDDFGTNGTVLAADTMCVMRGQSFGQPRDVNHARNMLYSMRGSDHETITGVCLISLDSGKCSEFCDKTNVEIGDITEQQIETYLASGDWRGKAGAYNLSERIAAGWPIRYKGDPTTVMGLPMQKLLQIYNQRT